MEQLYQPLTLDTIALKNRFVRSATWEGMADKQGHPTEQLCRCYQALAEGGCGMLITGYVAVDPLGLQFPGTLRLDSDAHVAPMRVLPETVHAGGSKIIAQLFHAGGQTGPKALGRPGLAPSALPFPCYDGTPEALTTEQITTLIQSFALAAHRAKRAGFDGVQLHGAHGYLIHQFLSPLTNQRHDTYGGSLQNRMRFLLEIVRAVRSAVGEEFPLLVKLNGEDHLDGGFNGEDAVEVAKALEETGVAALEISAGSPASKALSPVRSKIVAGENEGYNADLAAQVRSQVKLPILAVGGLRSKRFIETLYTEGVADLFSLCRPLIRQPDLVRRWQQGDEAPSTCTSCNGCFRPGLKGLGVRCVLDFPMEN